MEVRIQSVSILKPIRPVRVRSFTCPILKGKHVNCGKELVEQVAASGDEALVKQVNLQVVALMLLQRVRVQTY